MASPDIDMAEVVEPNGETMLEGVDDGAEVAEAGEVPMIADITASEKPEEDSLSGAYEWVIENFSQLRDTKKYSEQFEIGGHTWRLLVFPQGNKSDSLSLYLDVPDTEMLPFNWQRSAGFKLMLVNQQDRSQSFSKETNHTFTSRESDWGFTAFIPLQDITAAGSPYLVNDTLIIRVEVTVHKMLGAYDSRAETGFIGLKNQGATCYMNSLLQTLYHIPYFRKAVYHMPTSDEEQPMKSIPLALQSLFYKIQFQPTSVSTKMLTKSFGWDTYDSFMQHDVQELNRVLCEKLEEKMKGTKVEGVIQELFEGNTWNYIECVNVDYKSTRTESFMDLQLDVKGCKDLYASFDMYTAVEMLDGQNQYKAEGHGLQDAKKGVLFEKLPPVLQLQLKRFEYDFARDIMVKVNDRYEFFDELDLDVGGGKYLSPNADRKVRNLYKLHSVLVHSGGVHGGHYYAFIRPDKETWYRFDDERVTKEETKNALDEQFGEDEGGIHGGLNNNLGFKINRHSNAYMLVYIRLDDWDRIQCQVTEEDIAEHLRVRLKAEQEEKERKRKEKEEAHLYTYMKVATESDMKKQVGHTRFFDLVDHEDVKTFRVSKTKTILSFKKEVAEALGVPPEKQRFWMWSRRQNHTYRPSMPFSIPDDARVVDMKENNIVKHAVADLRLFLEPLQPNGELAKIEKNEILLFFKFYNPETEELSYVGCRFMHKNDRMSMMHGEMCKMAGLPVETPLLIYEEIKFEPSVMCERINSNSTLVVLQLEPGDIICFQRALGPEAEAKLRRPTVKSFLDFIRNRQIITFKALDNPQEEGLQVEMLKDHSYDEMCETLAAELRKSRGLSLPDGTYLRLTQHNCYSNVPKPSPIKFRGVDRLSEMLVQHNQAAHIIYYEVLDMPLEELEKLKTLKVHFHDERGKETTQHMLRLPRDSTVADVLEAVSRDAPGAPPTRSLRLLEVFYHKIFKIFDENERIDSINDHYWTLRAEAIPPEEQQLGPGERLIHVSHYSMEGGNNGAVQNFGDPFLLKVREDETLAQVKRRVQERLQVADEEFEKWKFSANCKSQPEYLADGDLVLERLKPAASAVGQEQSYLGLEHADKSPKRPQQPNSFERPVRIYN